MYGLCAELIFTRHRKYTGSLVGPLSLLVPDRLGNSTTPSRTEARALELLDRFLDGVAGGPLSCACRLAFRLASSSVFRDPTAFRAVARL